MVNGRRLRRARLRRAATDTAQMLGCTCGARIGIRQQFDHGDIAHLRVGHDDGCPAIVGRVYSWLANDVGRCGR